MKVVVITGSTGGIGYGLAEAFLNLGQAVIISGRNKEKLQTATEVLNENAPNESRVLGIECDVRKAADLQSLWDETWERFGRVDIWINNAGTAGDLLAFQEMEPQQMEAVVETNLLGVMVGCQVALKGMLKQGFGAIYNMEGFGSSGRTREGMTVYGTSKAGVGYLTDALAEEVKGSSIIVGGVQPGMVWTRMLSDQFKERPEELEKNKRVLGILVDRVETVAPWLAERILTNEKNGARINWYGRGKLFGRFLVAPFKRRAEVEVLR